MIKSAIGISPVAATFDLTPVEAFCTEFSFKDYPVTIPQAPEYMHL